MGFCAGPNEGRVFALQVQSMVCAEKGDFFSLDASVNESALALYFWLYNSELSKYKCCCSMMCFDFKNIFGVSFSSIHDYGENNNETMTTLCINLHISVSGIVAGGEGRAVPHHLAAPRQLRPFSMASCGQPYIRRPLGRIP